MKLLFFSAMLVPMHIFSLYKYTLVHAYTHTTACFHKTVVLGAIRHSLACFCPWHMQIPLPEDSFLSSVLTDSYSYSVTNVNVTPLEILPQILR